MYTKLRIDVAISAENSYRKDVGRRRLARMICGFEIDAIYCCFILKPIRQPVCHKTSHITNHTQCGGSRESGSWDYVKLFFSDP